MQRGLFENLMIAKMHKNGFYTNQHQDYWYCRDAKGNEVDLMLESGEKMNVYEIKANYTTMSD